MYDLEKIKTDNPLIDLMTREYGQGNKSGQWYFWICPFPNHAENTGSFAIDSNDKFHCFGCNKHGDLFDFHQFRDGWDFERTCQHYNGETMDIETAAERALQRAELQKQRLEQEIEATKDALQSLRETRAWIRYENQLLESEYAQGLWDEAGLPGGWQSFYHLGYARDFYAGESLTIPIYTPFDTEPVNVRHRIINANNGNKYRPELAGLPSSFYWANPDKGVTENIIIVEGEKKAMVLYRYLSDAGMKNVQIIGMIGKNGMIEELAAQLAPVKKVYIVPDPDVTKPELWKVIQTYKKPTTIIDLPYKVDDMFVDGILTASQFVTLSHTGMVVNV